MDLVITEKAKEKLKAYQLEGNRFLRISVVSGGCSGMSYSASVEKEIKGQDEVIYDDQELRIIADKKSTLFLEGLCIDFSDDLIQSGFRLTNPKASSSCACGASFAI